MNAISDSGSTGAGIYTLKQSEKLSEKMMATLMESLPQVEQMPASSSSGLASEGIGANLDIKG